MVQKSPAIEKLLDQYLHLPIAGKKIRCSYWIDKIEKGIWGPFGGKGKPEQIVKATLETARKQKIDIGKLSSMNLKEFMKQNRIGIDCSGLAYWLLDVLDREKGGNGLQDDIPDVKGRFLWPLYKLPRTSVQMLTSNEASVPINKVSNVKVGDMVRLQGGRHCAVIIRMKKAKDQIKELIYVHSSNLTEVKGVHVDKILINNPERELAKQTWIERTTKGENYGQKYFRPEKGDGVRRLKIWN